MTTSDPAAVEWVAASCTLPTAEQPLRVAEFDALFTTSVRSVDRLNPTTLRLTLTPAAEHRARELATREIGCCSFFRFAFAAKGDGVAMTVGVPPAHVAVLDALTTRATTLAELT